MKPIQDLLNRIRWDSEFGDADFKIGYYDRVDDRIITVPFKDINLETHIHSIFSLVDENGDVHTIPLHRIKQVYRNNELIWQRIR
jgi:uncharacterized protein (UPF0248 family)